MKVNKVAIFTNTTKLNTNEVALQMKEYFESKGIEVLIVNLSSTEEDLKIQAPVCDLAVSLGGDGTVLSCASILEKTDIPLLAVNMGSFGYITETAINEYKEVFEALLAGNTIATDRMRLNAKVFRKGKTIFEATALNDVTITSSYRAKVAKLNLSINGVLAATLKCDGIIIATPTGSTAYNLSAGGPIIEETLNNIIINPICSFTLSARPLVIDEKSTIEVEMPQQTGSSVLSADGHEVINLETGDVVCIVKNSKPTRLIKNNKRNSIEILRDKLGWAGGFNA